MAYSKLDTSVTTLTKQIFYSTGISVDQENHKLPILPETLVYISASENNCTLEIVSFLFVYLFLL